jgi:hypothetical protein
MYVNELEIMKEYQIRISNRFSTAEYLTDSKDINSAGGRRTLKKLLKTQLKTL